MLRKRKPCSGFLGFIDFACLTTKLLKTAKFVFKSKITTVTKQLLICVGDDFPLTPSNFHYRENGNRGIGLVNSTFSQIVILTTRMETDSGLDQETGNRSWYRLQEPITRMEQIMVLCFN